MKDLKVIIFDLDGVLFDSEPLHENAKRRILSDNGITENIDLSWSVGLPNKLLWKNMIAKYGLNGSKEEFEKLQYTYILEEVKAKDIKHSIGLLEELQYIRKCNYKIAMASSSDRFYVDAVLQYYNIYHFFTYIVAGDEVANKKPEPDIYQKILRLSDTKDYEVIAVEDTKAGSDAATAAGIRCIGYRNPTSGCQDLSKCCAIINTMNQLTKVLSELD